MYNTTTQSMKSTIPGLRHVKWATTTTPAHLLASLMSAMAIIILFLRKMRIRIITTSMMHRIITVQRGEVQD